MPCPSSTAEAAKTLGAISSSTVSPTSTDGAGPVREAGASEEVVRKVRDIEEVLRMGVAD